MFLPLPQLGLTEYTTSEFSYACDTLQARPPWFSGDIDARGS